MAIVEIHKGRAELCREVLDDLPEWFGIPDSNAAFVAAVPALPMFAAYVGEQSAGFVSLKRHTDFASEVYLLGVKRQFHRQGVGRSLIGAAVNFAAREGTSFLTVKTLGASNPNPNYAATRRFYQDVGFLPIEVFPTLWNANNPCLLMIRPLTC